jgi:hypothetical protein
MDYVAFYPQFKFLSLTNDHQNNNTKTTPSLKMHSKKEKKNMTHQAPLKIKMHFAHNQQVNKPREK